MNIFTQDLMSTGIPDISLKTPQPKHIRAGDFGAEGRGIAAIGNKIGAESVVRAGTFQDVMLQALDKVSAQQQFSEQLTEAAITDPDSVDAHDITIAQAKASMSLNITRTVLSRLVQGWRDLINTR